MGNVNNNGIANLAAGIVNFAQLEYMKAIWYGDKAKADYLKHWFSTAWGDTLCLGRGKETEEYTAKKAMTCLIDFRQAPTIVTRHVYPGTDRYTAAMLKNDLLRVGGKIIKQERAGNNNKGNYTTFEDVKRVIYFYNLRGIDIGTK